MKKKTATERTAEAREFVNAVHEIQKAKDLAIDAACKEAGKSLSGYYIRKRWLEGKDRDRVVTAKRKVRKTRVNLPVLSRTSGFTEIPATQRKTPGTGKMFLAVAVGDAEEIGRVIDNTLNRYFS